MLERKPLAQKRKSKGFTKGKGGRGNKHCGLSFESCIMPVQKDSIFSTFDKVLNTNYYSTRYALYSFQISSTKFASQVTTIII
ncbi:hypothetical protein H5410_042472 [Solanum commersonii]|uniref:Uncharacterized protein n=1 Tax=Solanum commersonii TaxID=4109 RepID=A0A9J5XYN2_SOLCO|nr:hypothetical protein H5410_042472 [Solanum commersonii]